MSVASLYHVSELLEILWTRYYKHNQSVDIGEKLVCTQFELLTGMYTVRIAQKGLLVLQIVHFCSVCLWFINHIYSLAADMMRLHMLKISVGKDRQIMKQLCLNTALQ